MQCTTFEQESGTNLVKVVHYIGNRVSFGIQAKSVKYEREPSDLSQAEDVCLLVRNVTKLKKSLDSGETVWVCV